MIGGFISGVCLVTVRGIQRARNTNTEEREVKTKLLTQFGGSLIDWHQALVSEL